MDRDTLKRGIYCQRITVPPEAIDQNGHLNNVIYVQWMQDIVIAHANHTSCTAKTAKVDATWIVRSHTVEYLRPAFEGEQLIALTWIANIRRVQSQRKYQFFRPHDQTLLATGETSWVFVSRSTGKPAAIPSTVASAFRILSDSETVNQIAKLIS